MFARAARAVRMTVALQSRLMKDLADLDTVDGLPRKARAASGGKRRRRARGAALDRRADARAPARSTRGLTVGAAVPGRCEGDRR
jgi:hypothetical protein